MRKTGKTRTENRRYDGINDINNINGINAMNETNEPITLRFAKLRPGAVLPSKRREDAGYDVFACLENGLFLFAPFQTRFVPTGILSAFPEGWYFQLRERGSTGVMGMAVRAGVIDSGFRGEWFVALTNLNP